MTNPNRYNSGKGIYIDIELNVINIIKRFLDTNPAFAKYASFPFNRANPSHLTVEKLPSFYVWCDGSMSESSGMGASLGRKMTKSESFFVMIQLLHSEANKSDGLDQIKQLGFLIQEAIYKNIDVNGLMNMQGEIIETTFFPKPLDVGGSIKSVQGFQIKVKYMRNKKSRHASGR